MKSVALVPVPFGFVAVIGPVVASGGTVAVIWVELFTVNEADVPLNATDVVPVRFVPVMVTPVPTDPLVGLNETIVGDPAAVTVKFVALDAVPPGVVTLILPVIAPLGTTAVICVAELTAKLVAEVFLNFTSVAPERFVPVMTTEVPTGPLIGTNDVIVGAGGVPVTSKLATLVAVPAEVVTLIGPSTAPDGTVVVICVPSGDQPTLVWSTPPNSTSVAPTSFVPSIVTVWPTGPLPGENPVTVGLQSSARTKSSVLSSEPSGVVTVIFPVGLPVDGTVAEMRFDELTVTAVASTPLNSTEVAPWKCWPPIATLAPAAAQAGENPVTTGAGAARATGNGRPTSARAKTTNGVNARAAEDRTDRLISASPSQGRPRTSGRTLAPAPDATAWQTCAAIGSSRAVPRARGSSSTVRSIEPRTTLRRITRGLRTMGTATQP